MVMVALLPGLAPLVTYTTWNPSDKGTYTLLSNGDLTATCGTGVTYSSVRTVASILASDKKVWEITVDSGSTVVGYGTSLGSVDDYPGHLSTSIGYLDSGTVSWNNTTIATFASYAPGDVIAVELDRSTNDASWYKNGVLQGSTTQGLAGAGNFHPMVANASGTGTSVTTANFGIPVTITPQVGFTPITA